jgi:plasmid maintenance system antidote protein VapI
MAIRLDKAFGGTADAWLALQAACELAHARKSAGNIRVRRYIRPPRDSDPQSA